MEKRQNLIEESSIYCPHCNGPLHYTGNRGGYVYYKCVSESNREYRIPEDRASFDEYRSSLNAIYQDAKSAKWDEEMLGSMSQRLAALSHKYVGIAENDTQYMLVDIQICTQNFNPRAVKKRRDMNHIKSIYNTTKQSNASFSPIDNFGTQLIEEYKIWDKAREDDAKKVAKYWQWAGIGVAAAAVIAFGVSCFMPNTQATETESGLTITARPDNDSYGMFKKWGVDFHARELVEGTSEYETASILLKNESEKYHIFDISMVSGSNIVQPIEPVRIEVTIPDDYYERNVAIYYINPNGRYESVKCEKVVAGDKRVAVFYAEHFSLYAIAEHPFNIGFSDENRDIPTQKVMWGKLVDEPTQNNRIGYDFLGWYDGDVKWDFDKMVAYDDITLVGKWHAQDYTLTLDYSDGRPRDEQKVVYDQAYALNVPTRVGYAFLGWYDENSVCLPDSGVWKRTENTTVYARWELEGYKIHFDARGGELDATEKEKGFTYGERYGALPTPQRPGYSFAGWYTQPDGGSRIESTTVISKAETHTLYARWNEMSFTVNFISNGGQSVPSQTYKYNDKVSRPGDLTREGYEFLGWYKDAACTKAFDFVADVVTADMTLYAKWGRGAITIAFDSKGGSSVDERRISQGDSLGDNLPTPTRTGYTFRGWFADSGCVGDRIYGTTTFTSSTTLYAKWEANTYTIKFDANGGVGSMAAIDAVYGVDKKLTSVGFSKSGYDFVGWSTSPEGSAAYTNADTVKNLCTEAKDSITLYAQWKIKTYTISYVTNGGVISGQTTKYTIYDESINIPDAVYPTYSEYNHFLGWYENEACTIPVRKDFKSNPADVILYAKWDLCDVFDSMDNTPVVLKGTNPLITVNQRVIIDWSKETDTNLSNHTVRDVGGTKRYDCIEIQNTVKEIIVIGNPNKSYSGIKFIFCDFKRGQEVTIKLDNFSFTASDGYAVEAKNDNGSSITVEFIGVCSIKTTVGGGSVINLPVNDLAINGIGEFSVVAGNGTSSKIDGSVGITAKNVKINASGIISINGGNGAKGKASGSAGGNGGAGIVSNMFDISGNVVFNICGGDGGAGADGAKGETGAAGKKGNNESQGKDKVYGYNGRPGEKGGQGQDGGAGGNGASAMVLVYNPTITNTGSITIKAGSGGKGGRAGDGGDGGRGGDGGDDDYWSFIGIGDMSGGEGGAGGAGGSPGSKGVGGAGASSITVNGTSFKSDISHVTQVDGNKGADGGSGEVGATGSKGNHGNGGGLGTS